MTDHFTNFLAGRQAPFGDNHPQAPFGDNRPQAPFGDNRPIVAERTLCRHRVLDPPPVQTIGQSRHRYGDDVVWIPLTPQVCIKQSIDVCPNSIDNPNVILTIFRLYKGKTHLKSFTLLCHNSFYLTQQSCAQAIISYIVLM